jgi:hypothetical protein
MVPKNPTGASAIAGSNFPTDVQEILASIDREFPKMHDRRVIPRWVFHAEAFLTIDHSVRHQLWTRDVNAWNIGFVSRQPIELGAQGTLRIEVPGG